MENQRRGMDSDQRKNQPISEKSLNPKELTIMVIRSVGKMRSFKLSRRTILWTSLFLLAYMIISLYTINRFFDLRNRFNVQSEKLERLEKDLNKNLKLLTQTKDYVIGLEEYIKNAVNQEGEKPTSVQKAEETKGIVDGTATKIPLNIVDIENAVIQREDSGMSIDFRLVNTIQDENAIEGYIHIIAMDKKNDYPPEWNKNLDRLQDGYPVNFRSGQPFLIQRFRPYHRQFNMNSNSDLPKTIRILVYNVSGDLILKKEFEVDNAS